MPKQSTVRPALLALMKDGLARTPEQIAAVLNTGSKYVRQLLIQLESAGEMRVVDFSGQHPAAVYQLGAGESVTRPPFKTSEQERAIRRALNAKSKGKKHVSVRHLERMEDEKYRASDTWWPRADPVVVGAMGAMVRVGRVPA